MCDVTPLSTQPKWQTITQGQLLFERAFLMPTNAEQLYEQLLHQLHWQQLSIKMFGKEMLQPRLQAWFGEKSYQYSGLKLSPAPIPEFLSPIQQRCEQVCQSRFNSVLINLYRNGQDSMGWHQDNEPELGRNPVIASLSLGAERKFVLKHNETNEKITYQLSSGSLLVMAGETQHFWKHALPKTTRVSTPRINLTFRLIE
ncbi:alpha-ketoglutarate-dependent dioxygenase AlkB family protein [Vibrio sp. LaRot3]|uniref:alpha-ketoglutarate-dependent dioxygenase AlkB family protein n=1 Tax=Vibrio sp. LaRot3 TaxID=2998829 RepID=UPI0022CDD708|nr:alpha-ketoglutarate-dependent dioxygenase AlkB [Vibrio sp. LaRot3]MDA0150161.1 alpha-ketoglutarate-dependent dioxygenase AlkB [Vibrio sp. LaRot3]